MNASSLCVLGTPLERFTYASLTADLQARSRVAQSFSVDFTNTHIVTLRRRDPEFRALTSTVDYFIPDGMPLIWCLNRRDALFPREFIEFFCLPEIVGWLAHLR